MRVRIRPAGEDDVGFLTDLAVEVTRDQGRWPEDEDEAEFRAGYADWTREQLRGEVADSTLSVLEVDGLQILPTHQSRGLGTAVLQDLAEEAAAAGLPLELGVEHDNPRARALYERRGFRPVGETEDEVRMRLDPWLTTD